MFGKSIKLSMEEWNQITSKYDSMSQMLKEEKLITSKLIDQNGKLINEIADLRKDDIFHVANDNLRKENKTLSEENKKLRKTINEMLALEQILLEKIESVADLTYKRPKTLQTQINTILDMKV